MQKYSSFFPLSTVVRILYKAQIPFPSNTYRRYNLEKSFHTSGKYNPPQHPRRWKPNRIFRYLISRSQHRVPISRTTPTLEVDKTAFTPAYPTLLSEIFAGIHFIESISSSSGAKTGWGDMTVRTWNLRDLVVCGENKLKLLRGVSALGRVSERPRSSPGHSCLTVNHPRAWNNYYCSFRLLSASADVRSLKFQSLPVNKVFCRNGITR